jgi:hypothetical protein
LLCIAGGPVHAQPAPANVRDGCVTGTVPDGTGTVDVDLFTVPAGAAFVLTDVQYDMTNSVASPNPQLVDDSGALRWIRVGGQLVGDHAWASGVKFVEGAVVRMRLYRSSLGYPYTICWAGYVGSSHTTSVVKDENELLGLKIGPNPMGSGATISFRLDQRGPVTLAIYDAGGRLVRRLQAGFMAPGDQQVRWDGSDRKGRSVDSGVYFARLETAGEQRTAKVVRTN